MLPVRSRPFWRAASTEAADDAAVSRATASSFPTAVTVSPAAVVAFLASLTVCQANQTTVWLPRNLPQRGALRYLHGKTPIRRRGWL